MTAVTVTAAPRNVSKLIPLGKMPARVHVFEDYETEIEKRWWLRGTPVKENLPPSLSASRPNSRASRATVTKDFDRKQGDPSKQYKAVIFNPVPGPPMGTNTCLTFRYWLKGTSTLRVQIYSLSKNYHRHLVLQNLPQGKWQTATVDMTQARRPDGSGGPLAADERIDDIQFYITPEADLRIDDLILYDAAAKDESRPFPRRILFTGWFDTGKQGKEWPGDFKIVPHEKPRTWDAAQAVPHPEKKLPWLRIQLRGMRELSKQNELYFKYFAQAGKDASLIVRLVNSQTGNQYAVRIRNLNDKEWDEVTIPFAPNRRLPGDRTPTIDEIHLMLESPGKLLVDDLLLYEPGAKPGQDSSR
ncbi:MAG: hypothetical protein CMO66_00035 [Verrucomicrobiales bacterium]|nr:hypothetical protein [Verrucomicrobiales bacterium]